MLLCNRRTPPATPKSRRAEAISKGCAGCADAPMHARRRAGRPNAEGLRRHGHKTGGDGGSVQWPMSGLSLRATMHTLMATRAGVTGRKCFAHAIVTHSMHCTAHAHATISSLVAALVCPSTLSVLEDRIDSCHATRRAHPMSLHITARTAANVCTESLRLDGSSVRRYLRCITGSLQM